MIKLIRMLLIPVAAVAIYGCAPKPPVCDDPQIADLLRQGIPRDGQKSISTNIEAAGNWQRPGADKLRAELDAFTKSIKVELATITTDGYDADAKRHSCMADLTVAMEGDDGTPMQIKRMPYSIQGTSDGKDFVLNVPQYGLILSGVSGGFTDYTLRDERAAAVASATAAAQASSESASACVAAKMAAFRRKLDQDLRTEFEEAEAKGYLFKGMSPPAMEEWEEKHMAQAKKECP